MKKTVLFGVLCILPFAAHPIGNTPCSGQKGGIHHCNGEKFVCVDGSVSQSKAVCTGYDKPALKKNKPKSKKRRHHKRHKAHHRKSGYSG